MAGAQRLPAAPVEPAAEDLASALARDAARLPFFPLVALLERLSGSVGTLGLASPSEERVRFRHDPSLGFSAGDISGVSVQGAPGAQERTFEVHTTFLGLTGAVSPLPLYLAEEIAQEDPDRAPRREFLDVFHHRLLALLYRGLASHGVEQEPRRDGTDVWARRVLALAGLDTYAHPASARLPPARLLRLAALLAGHARTARTLELALADVFSDVLAEGCGQVTLQQFRGAWVDIDGSERMALGRANTQLGRSAVLGRRVYDRSGAFEIVLGPVSHHTYRRFLPEGDLLPLLQEVVGLFSRDMLTYSVVVVLMNGQAPSLCLTHAGGSRLGRDSWLGAVRAGEARVPVHDA